MVAAAPNGLLLLLLAAPKKELVHALPAAPKVPGVGNEVALHVTPESNPCIWRRTEWLARALKARRPRRFAWLRASAVAPSQDTRGSDLRLARCRSPLSPAPP